MIVAESDPVDPEVSVIVPAFNSARTINRCLTALAEQRTTHTFEIIVVHSGTDDTCARARSTVGCCRTYQQQQRMCPSAARHYGVLKARGAILAFIDSDIFVANDWVDTVVAAARTGNDLVCGSIANANPDSIISRAEHLLMFNEFLPGTVGRASWFALSGNMVLPRTAYGRFGPFPAVRAAEDIVFSRKLIGAGGTVWFYPELKVVHDNRTTLWPFLKNQWLLGRHTAAARRHVDFADSRSHLLFLLLLPIAPAVKLARIVARLATRIPRRLWGLLGSSPFFCLGLCVYCAGMASTTVSPVSSKLKGPAE